MRLTLALLLVLGSACVKGVPRCETQGRGVRARPLDEAVQPCMRLLTSEPVDSSRSLIGLTTDTNGKISRVCLAGSTHEPDSKFLKCVFEQLEQAPAVLPPNQQCLIWTLNVGY